MSPVGREGNIVAALENQARTQPAFPALVEPKIPGLRRTERSVTFSELFDHSTVLAKGLAQYGFAPGDRVAVFVPHPSNRSR